MQNVATKMLRFHSLFPTLANVVGFPSKEATMLLEEIKRTGRNIQPWFSAIVAPEPPGRRGCLKAADFFRSRKHPDLIDPAQA